MFYSISKNQLLSIALNWLYIFGLRFNDNDNNNKEESLNKNNSEFYHPTLYIKIVKYYT